MTRDVQQQRLDEALDRIEKSILPCIAMVLDTLLETSELGETQVSTQDYAAELRTLALQLEALTAQIETISPVRSDAGASRSADAA